MQQQVNPSLKRTFWIALMGILMSVNLVGCKLYQPEIRGVESVNMNRDKEAGKGQLAVEVGVRVFNPNNYKVALKRYDLEFYLNGKSVGNSKSKEKIKMKGNEESIVHFTVNTTTKKLSSAMLWAGLSGLTSGGKLKLKVKGTARGKAHGFGKNFQVDHTEPVDLDLDDWLK